MSIGRRGDRVVAARPAARLRGVLRRLPRGGPARWTGAATASAVAVPLVLVAVLGQGHAIRELAQTNGSAWVASPQQGIVSLVDGASDAVAAALRVPPAATLEVEQDGSSAYVVDDAAGTVARIDGATYEVTAPIAFGTPGGSLSVLQGVDDVYVLDATRRTATVVDPRTLGALDEVSLSARPGPGQAVVDDDGRLWVVDDEGGGLTWFDGTHHVQRDAADADDRLVLVRGRPVLVDPSGRTVAPLGDTGAVGTRSCLEVRADDTVQVLGSTDRDEVYATIAETGTLVIAAVGRDDCGRVVPVEEPGTPVDFGPLAQSGRFLFVPNHLTGQVVVVDLRDDAVAGRLDLTPAGNRLQLVAKDGVVFYNDLDGDAVGVLHLAGGVWVQGAALSKYDRGDGEPVAVVTPDEPDPVPDAGAPAPDAGTPEAGPTPPVREPDTAPFGQPAAPWPPTGPSVPGPGGPGPVQPTPSPSPSSPAPTTPPPPTRVAVQVTVAGAGRVTSTPAGIDCPGTCEALVAPGTEVTLTAVPGPSAVHLGWSGACSAVPAGEPCRITVQSAAAAGATFGDPPARATVVVTVVGPGSVVSDPPGLTCDPASSPCTADFSPDVTVLLTAVADPGSRGGTWAGDCSSRHCELPPGAGGTVTATFVQPQLVTVTEPTGGRITGPGIDCPGDCDEWVDEGAVVTLTATQDEDARFVAWAQDCSGTSTTCDLTVDTDPAVGATFEPYPIGSFAGTWHDVDGTTLQAVVTATGAASGAFEFWGSCAPTGCYWGNKPGTVSGGTVFVLYDNLNAADRHVTLSRDGALLRAEVYSDYYDDRPNRTDVYLLSRAG
ncbi:InlB B-repeat-containing protein [Cellulomonas sp. S1-8]|uniref:InlB B-repeat-containing protein n=1 Tax=Cellulomonas sp. S1-8 TaxID=2904790 RepID=UPI002244BCDD|nr:hypothetical protein [Cellulomonas sp. S1-8]UZN03982.1 hypothetical protein OKX07_03305 [Cellulomonas sp. S1-8]